jgi:hypothetical protein
MADLSRIMADIFKPKGAEEIPVIYAKRNLDMVHKYNLKDKSFEGLRRVARNGKVIYEVDENYSGLVIDGETGYCKIHDTENNRKRFERCSRPQKRTVMVNQLDPDTGENKVVPTEIIEKPMYERIDQSIIQRTDPTDITENKEIMAAIIAKVKEELENKALNEEGKAVISAMSEPKKISRPKREPLMAPVVMGEGNA